MNAYPIRSWETRVETRAAWATNRCTRRYAERARMRYLRTRRPCPL